MSKTFNMVGGGAGGSGVRLQSIAIAAPPNTVSYKTGSLFDPTGMSVWAEFSNGYGLYVNHADLVFDPAGPLEEGTESVTVRFYWGGETAEAAQAVNVYSTMIFGVEWTEAPAQSGPARTTRRGLQIRYPPSTTARAVLLSTIFCPGRGW